MPPKSKRKDCLVILVNVGRTNETENKDEPSFLENSKLTMKLLIQRKIFVLPNDEVGIIIMGASQTKNRLSYDNIVELNPLQIANWDLIEKITKLEGTNKSANWVDGMSVVLEYINAECVEPNATRTVIMFNDFKEEPDVIEQYDMKTIADDIKAAELNFLAIGNKSFNADSQIKLNPSEELFANVCQMVEGKTMTFKDTIPKLMIYKDKSKTPMGWRVDMDLFDIEIPVIMYLKTTEDFKLPAWQLYTNTEGDDSAKIPVQRSYALVDKNKKEFPKEEIITGNWYGRKFIPFSDEDRDALKYESGPKGFMIYGFTKQQYVTIDCLAGKGAYIVVPAQGAAAPFYSLVKAMADQNKVAIVRRVYRAGTAPKMGALVPKINNPGDPWCLIYVELTFAEDRRIVQVKPIKSAMRKLSKEQEEAVDDLIESMMLMEVKDESTNEIKEALQAGTVPDISRQYVWDRLTHRAMNPASPLPPMSDFLKEILEPPMSVKNKSKPALEMIRSLFPLRTVQKKISVKKRFNKMPDEPGEISTKDPQPVWEGLDELSIESNGDNNMQGLQTEDEELCRITESVEAASQDMDVDLEELARQM